MFFPILFGVLGLIAIYLISKYNGFVHLRALVDEAWSGIDVQLKRRYDLIPNLVETVKGYATHEKEVFEAVTKMRSVSMNANTIEDKSRAELKLDNALRGLYAVAESYPDLKANENFANLQKELSSIESELQLARRYYNGTVRNYNISVQSFPASIIANMTGFAKASYFEVENDIERKAPSVKL